MLHQLEPSMLGGIVSDVWLLGDGLESEVERRVIDHHYILDNREVYVTGYP